MKINLNKFIVPRVLENVDGYREKKNMSFNTIDHVWTETGLTGDFPTTQRGIRPTDYAIANGSQNMSKDSDGRNEPIKYWGRKSAAGFVRRRHNLEDNSYTDPFLSHVSAVDHAYSGAYSMFSKTEDYAREDFGVRPFLDLNLASVISARSLSQKFGKIGVVSDDEGKSYHTIEFGEYPNHMAKNSDELEKKYQSGVGLQKTGKEYVGYLDKEGNPVGHEEFEYKGEKFVRVKAKSSQNDEVSKTGTKTEQSEVYGWFKVEPLVWVIGNWEDLPKSLNPKGNGTAEVLQLGADNVIMSGIPFYPNYRDKNGWLWQNSCVRGFLNGINVAKAKGDGNGNKRYGAPGGGDWTGRGFLQQAFGVYELTPEFEVQRDQQKNGNKAMHEIRGEDKPAVGAVRDVKKSQVIDEEMLKVVFDARQSMSRQDYLEMLKALNFTPKQIEEILILQQQAQQKMAPKGKGGGKNKVDEHSQQGQQQND